MSFDWPPMRMLTGVRAVFWLVLLLIIVLSLAPLGHPDFSPNDKLNHLLAWGLLGLLGCAGWSARRTVIILLWCASFGLEGAQGLTGYRSFSFADGIANGVGLLTGYILITLIDRLRARHQADSGSDSRSTGR